MKFQLLRYLACPACSGSLAFSETPPHREDEEILSGTLLCKSCGLCFPIVDSIPRLFCDPKLEPRVHKTQESFTWEWMHYPGSLPEDKEIFLTETQIPEADWSGRLILDAGCGMGRYARVALSLGSQVVAFDLSDSLLRLLSLARRDKFLHLVQGDLLHPPFKGNIFDVVYSQGVLHHTRDARAAFQRLAPLVKKQGLLAVWVYGRAGSYRSFSSNPLRSDRVWLRRLLPIVWALVGLRQLLSNSLRCITTRLPARFLYILCYPLALLGALPWVQYATFSVHPDFRVRLIENFDWLAPPYQSKHTKEEVEQWFQEAGFQVLKFLSHGMIPKVGILGKKYL